MFALYIFLLSVTVSFILAKSSLTSSTAKVFLILLLMHGFLTVSSTFKEVSGYPTATNLPKKFEVIYARVVEQHDNKFIEMWIKFDTGTLDKIYALFSLAHEWNDISRVYRLPYTRDNHEMVLEIEKKILAGEKVGIKFDKKSLRAGEVNLRKAEEKFRVDFESRRIPKEE
jgi:hypothetical protein